MTVIQIGTYIGKASRYRREIVADFRVSDPDTGWKEPNDTLSAYIVIVQALEPLTIETWFTRGTLVDENMTRKSRVIDEATVRALADEIAGGHLRLLTTDDLTKDQLWTGGQELALITRYFTRH